MEFDPFAETVSTAGIVEADIHEASDVVEVSESFQHSSYHEEPWEDFSTVGGFWAYDLEAVPDETRFPRPEIKEAEFDDSFDPEAVLKTTTSCQARLGEGVCPEQLLILQETELGRTKGARKGVLDVIRKTMEGGDAEWRKWHALGARPETARIVAMAVCAYGDPDHPRTWIAKTRDDERRLVQDFFDLYDVGTTRCGYNIAGYDDRLIFWRAMALGVRPIKPLALSRYGGRGSIDLMAKMFSNLGDAMKLKSLLAMLGIVPPAGDMDGSRVLELVDSDQWDLLAEYVASDAWSELLLLAKVQQVLEL